MWLISYWVLPLISAVTWLGTLLAMLIVWLAQGRPRYPSMEQGQTIAYISDVGAEGLKPLFITGSCIMTIFLDLAFVSERWLRHKGRLARNTGTSEKVLVTLSIISALVGTCGLILLTIFDTLRHPSLHRLFLLLFMLGYVLSAIFICSEYQRLGIRFRQFRILRLSFWIKLAFIIVEVVLAVAFGVCLYKKIRSAGAILEWIIAFIFTFYILVFLIDLLPATRGKHRDTNGEETEMGAAGTAPQTRHATDGHTSTEHNNNNTANAPYHNDDGREQAALADGRDGARGANGYYANQTNGFQVPLNQQNKPIAAQNF